jgi:pyruvate, water dikinase
MSGTSRVVSTVTEGPSFEQRPQVLAFTSPACQDVSLSGGKGASLAVMVAHGLPVPPGFVVTSAAFAAAVDGEALRELAVASDMEGARALIASARPPEPQVTASYDGLGQGPVAVRSSACAEDGHLASYAGQQETFLNVCGATDVLHRIVDCWLSFFSERAVWYRGEKGSLADVAMAVVVQTMVDADKAGVIFTADPVRRRRDRMVVEAALGLGENVVSGQVTPDNYLLDKKGLLKRSRVVNDPVLSEAELSELGELGLKLEELNGGPQDIEWAYKDGRLYLLQARPVTTL